jgi:hypothetical protein
MAMHVGAIICVLLLAVFSWRLHRTDSIRSAFMASAFAVAAVVVASALITTDALAPEPGHKSKHSHHAMK